MLLVSKIKEDLILETSKILNYLVCMCLIKGLYIHAEGYNHNIK